MRPAGDTKPGSICYDYLDIEITWEDLKKGNKLRFSEEKHDSVHPERKRNNQRYILSVERIASISKEGLSVKVESKIDLETP